MTDFNPITGRADSVYFLGVPTPGLAAVEGNSGSPRKWQERSGFGVSGSTLVFGGIGLAPFDVKVRLYTVADWNEWYRFLPVLKAPERGPGGGVQAGTGVLSVMHPWLKMHKISQCIVRDISYPDVDDYGVAIITIFCQAWRAAKLTLAKPEGAKATPTDPVDAQIDANRALIAAQREALAQKEALAR